MTAAVMPVAVATPGDPGFQQRLAPPRPWLALYGINIKPPKQPYESEVSPPDRGAAGK